MNFFADFVLFPSRALSGALALLAASAIQAEEVHCHYTYGGETGLLVASPTGSPYTQKGIAIGSYFQFRVVFQKEPADLASIKIYTYVDRDTGPALIHQASHAYPPVAASGAAHGFTGLHFVHEPVRDGELQYWCELTRTPAVLSTPASAPAPDAGRTRP